jgi:hypothetical protein
MPTLAQTTAQTKPKSTQPKSNRTATTRKSQSHSAKQSNSGPTIAASSDKATIVFFRAKKFMGAAISFKVREGEQELGKLSSGTYFVATVPPGAHTYVVHSEAKDELHIEVDAGQIYYVQGTVSMGVLVGHPNLSPADAAAFDAVKAKLTDSAAPRHRHS